MSLADKSIVCIVPGTVPVTWKVWPTLTNQSLPVSGIRVEFEPESKRIKLENMNTKNEHNEDMSIDDILIVLIYMLYTEKKNGVVGNPFWVSKLDTNSKPYKKLRVSYNTTKPLQRLMKHPGNYFEGFVMLYETKKGFRICIQLRNPKRVSWYARNLFLGFVRRHFFSSVDWNQNSS
jgi:hypothetical protein